MKNRFHLLFIVFILTLSSCRAQKINITIDEFRMDFSKLNESIRGELGFFGEQKDDLSTLTYSRYLALLKEKQTESTKFVPDIVEHSEQHYFEARKNTFFIVIYSKQLNAVIFDDANSFGCDSVVLLKENEPVPDLKSMIKEKTSDVN